MTDTLPKDNLAKLRRPGLEPGPSFHQSYFFKTKETFTPTLDEIAISQLFWTLQLDSLSEYQSSYHQ